MKKDKKRVDYLTQEDKDNSLILLQDVKKIFAEKKVDRIFTADLIKYLCETPYPQPGEFEPKSRWVDYNGFRKSINHTQLARLLNIYGVHSLILKIGKKRLRGYERGHFEKLEPIDNWEDWRTGGLKKGGRSSRNPKFNIADTEPAMRFKKYLEEVRTIPDSENITEENIIKRFLRGLYRLFGWKE